LEDSRQLTFEQRADLPPAGDASLAGVLAQRGLQEEHGDPTRKEENEVRDEEGPWMEQTQKCCNQKSPNVPSFLPSSIIIFNLLSLLNILALPILLFY